MDNGMGLWSLRFQATVQAEQQDRRQRAKKTIVYCFRCNTRTRAAELTASGAYTHERGLVTFPTMYQNLKTIEEKAPTRNGKFLDYEFLNRA
jgi:hypothetical protein